MRPAFTPVLELCLDMYSHRVIIEHKYPKRVCSYRNLWFSFILIVYKEQAESFEETGHWFWDLGGK